jgi:hypothetical protein
MRRERSLVLAAVTVLRQPAVSVGHVNAEQAAHRGLYASYGSTATWRQLGSASRRTSDRFTSARPRGPWPRATSRVTSGLGKRGVQSPTGSSTRRRSLAALLASTCGYRGIPRKPAKPGYFSNFGLSEAHDEELSAWMKKQLSLALWPHDVVAELDMIETQVLGCSGPSSSAR